MTVVGRPLSQSDCMCVHDSFNSFRITAIVIGKGRTYRRASNASLLISFRYLNRVSWMNGLLTENRAWPAYHATWLNHSHEIGLDDDDA